MRRWLLASLALVLLASCIQDPPGDAALWRDAGGSVVVESRPCPGDVLDRVTLVNPANGVVGDDDDLVYWQVGRSVEGAPSPPSIVTGSVPEGFLQTAPLLPLPTDSQLTAWVQTRREEYVIEFRPADLRTDTWLADSGGMKSPSEFDRGALGDC